MRLGRLPHDSTVISAIPLVKFGAILAPPVVDRSLTDFLPNMYGNNIWPDCTAVSYANAARSVAAKIYGYGLVVEDSCVPEFYRESIGAAPDVDLATTDGANMAEVAVFQQQHGYNIGPQSLVAAYKTVDSTCRNELALSISHLGNLWMGVTLHARDMDTFNNGQPWDTTPDNNDGPVEGGHAINGYCYTGLGDTDKVYIGTWGQWQPVTWRWLQARLDEAFALTWYQLRPAPVGAINTPH